MKKVLLAMLCALVMFSTTGCAKKPVANSPDTVIIKVNNSNITQGDFDKLMEVQKNSPMLQALQGDAKQTQVMELVLKDKVVNEMIVKRILLDEIDKRKITVSQKEVDEYIKKVSKQVGSEEKFYQVLEQQGITKEKFNEMAQEDLKVNKLIASLAFVNVSDSETKKFYDENKTSKFTYPDKVRASHILIMAPEKEIRAGIETANKGASKEEIDNKVQAEIAKRKAKAESILAEINKDPSKFAELAKKYSEDTGNAPQGGDLGFFSKDEMVKEFSDKAFSMKPDSISGLVQTEYGFHIIKVTDRKSAGQVPYKEAKNEIKAYLEDQKKVEVLKKLVDSKKATTEIIYLDQNYNPEKIQYEVKKLTGDKGLQAPMPPSSQPEQ